MRFLITVLCLIQSSVLICQNIITVCALESTPSQYHTLQAAVDAATTGDIIHVLPSPLVLEGAIVDKALTIMGPGHEPNPESGLLSQVGVIELSNSVDVLIEGLVLTQVAVAIGSSASNTTVRRNRFVGNGKFIYTQQQSNVLGSENWIIEGNVFTSDEPPNSTPVLYFNEKDTSVVFRNNYVDCFWTYQSLTYGRPFNAIFSNNLIYMRHGDYLAEYNGDLLFHSNIFYVDTLALDGDPDFNIGCNNCTFQGNLFYSAAGTLVDPQETASTNIMNQQPMFVNAEDISWSVDKDYHLVVGSPGIGDGLSGQDVGIHGNLFNFNMSGRPSGVPIITSLSKAYDIVPVDAPLEIEIETETAE